jgi:hypothetical protein
MASRSHNTRLETVDTNADHPEDLKDSGAHIEEVAIARLTEEDIFNLSIESLRFWSWTGFRITLIMVVHGFNQAGYGIDWVRLSHLIDCINSMI